MWIRTTRGSYINTDAVFNIKVCELPSGDISVTAYTTGDPGVFETIAMFNSKTDAQDFLDKFMKKMGMVHVVDMGEWNYTGHKKDHKEKRHGGS